MSCNSDLLYTDGTTPYELATKVLKDIYVDVTPPLPIDPFLLVRKYGIVYQFANFKKLEGLYLVPEDEHDIPFVAINYSRPITRQRFTAAHELCHHIKDRKNETCAIDSKNEIERFAESFAAELLMPRNVFLSEAEKYMQDGKISLDGALLLSEEFGVSFNSCARRLAYTFKILDTDYSNLQKTIKKYKPDNKKIELGIDPENTTLLRQAIDSYQFFFSIEPNIVWYEFKNDFIFNENRMEGLNIESEEVAEIMADLRMNGNNSLYCKESYEDIIQVLGHSDIYEYIMHTSEDISIYKLLTLNQKLFQFAPFPEYAGGTRTDNNLVLGATLETVDYKDVAMELVKLAEPVENLVKESASLSTSEYLQKALKIHHRITQIHPFRDGNGRCARGFLNWMLRLKNLPPIYLKHPEKDSYYTALKAADSGEGYNALLKVIIKALFKTIINVNKDTN